MAREAPVAIGAGQVLTSTKFNNELILNLQHILATVINGVPLGDYTSPPTLGVDVGDIKTSFRNADIGISWLLCDGRTVGSSASGASVANDDMLVIFTHLWDNSTNAELIIQTSGGSPTTRGASAAADWASNKRLPIPDFRGRVAIGMDDPGTSGPANVVTAVAADVLGGASGAETHTLTTAQLASHSHSWGPLGSSGGYGAVDSLTASSSGLKQTGNAGGGGAHNNMQPYLTVNYFISTGAA